MFPESKKATIVAAAGERGVLLSSVDDLERRGFNIYDVKSQCLTGFDALLVATEMASQMLLEEEEITKKRKKKRRLLREKALKTPIMKRRSFSDNQVVRDMPENMRKVIESLNGDDIKLVIQKCLFHTDMNDHHHRMSIPVRQIRADFLTEEDKRLLDDGKRQMTLLLVQPSLVVSEIGFKKWKLGKTGEKKTSYSYVLQTGWNDVKAANGLKEGDQVQLWSFRINQQLCLALVRVGKPVQY